MSSDAEKTVNYGTLKWLVPGLAAVFMFSWNLASDNNAELVATLALQIDQSESHHDEVVSLLARAHAAELAASSVGTEALISLLRQQVDEEQVRTQQAMIKSAECQAELHRHLFSIEADDLEEEEL